MNDFRTRFWKNLCGFRRHVFAIFALDLLLLALLLFSYVLVDRSSSAYVVLHFDFVFFASVLIGSSYILFRCKRRGR